MEEPMSKQATTTSYKFLSISPTDLTDTKFNPFVKNENHNTMPHNHLKSYSIK
jgi:hypothetical protein